MKSVLFSLLTLTGLSLLPTAHARNDDTGRWYSAEQLERGKQVFAENCAVCHGPNAASTPDWKKADASGNYPPPPLDGSAHAWHHDLELLRRTVREGGVKIGGRMPPFAEKLSAADIDAAISYFQSKWPDETYRKWAGRFPVDGRMPSLDDIERLARGETTTPAQRKPRLDLLQQRLGLEKLGPAEKTRLPGLYRVEVGGRNVYLSEDGEIAIIGDMIDLKNGVNLSRKP